LGNTVRGAPEILMVLAAILSVCAGCNSTNAGGNGAGLTTKVKLQELRIHGMAAADVYAVTIIQGLDELRAKTKRPEVAQWTMDHRLATLTAVTTNATQSSDAGSLLDTMVYSTLKRKALEEHWIPTLLKEEGETLRKTYEHAERSVWTEAAEVLAPKQIEELKLIIEEWRRANPGQYYVSHVRIGDITTAMRLTRESERVKLPGSVFGLLYLDPLSGLDPVTAELHNYRALTERMVYLMQRMPMIVGMQAEVAAINSTNAPQLVRINDSMEKIGASFAKITEVFAKWPSQISAERQSAVNQVATATAAERKSALEQVSAERDAALKQVQSVVAAERKAALDHASAAVAAERKAIFEQVDKETGKVQKILADAKGVVDRIDQTGASLKTNTTQTVGVTEQAATRIIDRVFIYLLVLAGVLLIGIPVSMLAYRAGRRRIAAKDDLIVERART
jgi:hypothetical protein